jgi:sodium-dependent dicarboxylate transporter 2/3/5
MGDRRAVVAAVVAFVAVATVPLDGLTSGGQYALATTAFAGVLWTTGGLPLPVTALTVPVALVAFGAVPDADAAVSGFADPIIFLLLAGFVLAEALQKHGIDRRIAYRVLVALGTSPRRVVFAVMAATAGLSMVISNSATTAMMVPVALGIADSVLADAPDERLGVPNVAAGDWSLADQPNLRVAMVLGVAYAASIGGVGTLIGTPPNAIIVSQLADQLDYTVSFADWLVVGLPFVAVGLPLTWYLLVGVFYPPGPTDASTAREQARGYLRDAGTLSAVERRVLLITVGTAVLWLLGGLDFLVADLLPPSVQTTLFGGTGDHLFGSGGHEGVLYFVVVGLLAIPALFLADAIEWADVQRIDWGTIVLLGGGISLANALSATGATRWLAGASVDLLLGHHALLVALAIAAVTVVLSEIASNTAMAAISVPILISLGPAYAGTLGTSATTASVFLAVTGGVAASFGFALPVATPPNAIAFGTGHLTRRQMLRPGLVLDVLMVVVTALVSFGLFTVVWPVVA